MVPRATFLNERRFLSLDLLFGHDVSATMYQYLLHSGMTPEEMTCALPASHLEEIVASIKHTAQVDTVVAKYAANDARRFD